MPYDRTIYLGSAAHYRYGRPAYSPELEAVLTQETGLDGNGRLLDAGCGPGVLTVRLAHLFAQAVGYTHLLAGSKRNPRVADALEARVSADYPELYERC